MKRIVSVFLIITIIFAMVPLLNIQASAYTAEYQIASIGNGEAILYSYSGNFENYEVPEYYDDYPDYRIVGVYNDVFGGNTYLKRISLNSNLKEIGERAFKNCINLASVEFDAQIDCISSEMFSGCTSLASIILSDTVSEIDSDAFKNCSSLEELYFPLSLSSTDNAFSGCTSLSTIYYAGNQSDWNSIQFSSSDRQIISQANIVYNIARQQVLSQKNSEKIEKVVLGSSHTAALTKNHDLYLWGNNYAGEIGDGSSDEKCLTPKKIMSNVKDVSLGYNCSAAVTENGELYIWGNIGNGKGGKPIFIASNVKFVTLSNAAYGRYAYISNTDDLYICGENDYGQVGNGTTEVVNYPQKILSNVKKVALQKYHSAAITNSGELYVWGSNDDYRVCGDMDEEILFPKKLLDNVDDVFLGLSNTAALTSENGIGKMYIWGDNHYCQIGNGYSTPYFFTYPYDIISSGAKQIACADNTSICVAKNGELYAWGQCRLQNFDQTDCDKYPDKKTDDVKYYVSTGYLTNGYLINYDDKLQYFDGTSKGPVLLDSVDQICGSRVNSSVIADSTDVFYAAIDYDGNLYMWGNNISGELGNGTTQDIAKPTKVELNPTPEQPTQPHTTSDKTTIYFHNSGDLSAYVGETKGVMVILDSAKYDFIDVSITSSNPDVVKIKSINVGEGPYYPESSEKVATVYLEFVSVGSAALTACAPDGTSNSLALLSLEQDVTKPGFTPKTDGWGFVNGRKGFNYSPTYHIPESAYEEVFGKSYVATAKANQGEIFNSMIDQSWGGNCYGMSVTACLFYLDMIEKDEFMDNNATINSYYDELHYDDDKNTFYTSVNNSRVSKLIEKYQILQVGAIKYDKSATSTYNLIEGHYYFAEGKKYRGWFKKTDTYEHIPEGDYIQYLLNIASNLDSPMGICLSKGNVSHGIVLRNDKKPKDLGDGWYAVYVYDPNHPYFSDELYSQCNGGIASYYISEDSEDTYIELNPSQNKWRYHASLNSNSEESYWGCDSQGNIIMSSYGEKDGVVTLAPNLIYFFSISNCNYPLAFDGTEPWIMPDNGKTIVYLSSDSTINITSENGDLISEIVDGNPIDGVDDLDFYPNYSTSIDDSVSNSGKLIIPYTEFKVEYISGSDITLVDDNSAFNLSSEKDTILNINMDSNEVQIVGNDNSDIIAQITELIDSDEYTSVVIDGNISQNDTISVSLQESELVVDNQIQSNSSLSITTDNETAPEEKQIMTLSSVSNVGESKIDDVREDNILSSGTTGDCTWTLTEDGVLTISGNGRMEDYNYDSILPWGTSISSVIIQNGVTNISKNAFFRCRELNSVSIPCSVSLIDDAAFCECKTLSSIVIPNSVKELGWTVFGSCEGLESVSLSNSITVISPNTFIGCDSLRSISLPNNVTIIGDSAFASCNSLGSIVIPDGVISIGNSVFWNCVSLKSIVIPNSVTSIGSDTFYACTNLESITIPNSVTIIGHALFDACSNLKNVTLSNKVTIINNWTFRDCVNLESIRIPVSVSRIGDSAFKGCFGLNNVYYSGSEKEWNNIDIGSNNVQLTNATIHFACIESTEYPTILPTEMSTPSSTETPTQIPTTAPSQKATVTIKGFFGQSETREFNVGDEFTVYTTLNCKDIEGGYIGSLKGEQQYTDSILENIDEKEVRSGGTYFKNLDLIFPTNIDASGNNKTTANAGISGRIPYNASSPEFAEKAFSYNKDDSLLIVTKYKVIAPGDASVVNSLRTLALADRELTRIIDNNTIMIDDFTLISSFDSPKTTATVTIKGFFGQSETREFNVGDEFTVYTTLNCKDIGGGYIGSLRGEQQYTDSILENIDEKEVRSGGTYFKNLDLIFPTNIDNSGDNKTTSNAGISGRIPYIASSPEFAEEAFSYNKDDSLLIVTKYKVTAPGYATVTNTMRTIALADYSLTRVVEKDEIVNDNFTLNSYFDNPTINAKDISSATVILSQTSYTYDDNEKKPSVTVKDGSKTLTSGTDYTVSYSDNINVGTATVRVTGLGDYTGSASMSFTINAKSISSTTITLSQTSYTYDGTAKEPSVTVKDGSKTLTFGTDYTVSFSNNTNAGSATVTVTGKGNYSGSTSKAFTINAKSISSTTVTLSQTSYTYDGTAKEPTVTVKDGSKTLASGTDYTVSYSNNTNSGTATVTVTGKGNYTGSMSKSFTINAKSISSTSVTLSQTSYTYDGAEKKPTVTVKDGSKTLTSGTDYTVSYFDNINAGTATVIVIGRGNYTGTANKSFTINSIVPQVEILLGDVDGDEDVSSVDVTLIQRFCADFVLNISEESLMNGDVDGNGDIEIVDATYIQRYLAEFIVAFPIGEWI